MPDPESILTTHYEAVRDEEMERIRLRDLYLVWYATVSAAAAGVYLKDRSWWGLLASVPILTTVAGALYAHTDVTLGSLSHWLRHTYSTALDEYRKTNHVAHPLPHWDGSPTHHSYVRSLAFGLRYLSVSGFLAAVGTIALLLVGPDIGQKFARTHVLVWLVLLGAVLLGAGLVLWAWKVRIREA